VVISKFGEFLEKQVTLIKGKFLLKSGGTKDHFRQVVNYLVPPFIERRGGLVIDNSAIT
jgi:hypothetical protein